MLAKQILFLVASVCLSVHTRTRNNAYLSVQMRIRNIGRSTFKVKDSARQHQDGSGRLLVKPAQCGVSSDGNACTASSEQNRFIYNKH